MSRQKPRKNRDKSEDEEEIDTEVNEIIESGGSR